MYLATDNENCFYRNDFKEDTLLETIVVTDKYDVILMHTHEEYIDPYEPDFVPPIKSIEGIEWCGLHALYHKGEEPKVDL